MAFTLTEDTKAKNETSYKVIKKFGAFSTDAKGKKYEVRLVSWNGKPIKYDIRQWWKDADGNEVCGKGITLNPDQIEGLFNLLTKMSQ